jgi:hypothetical protein
MKNLKTLSFDFWYCNKITNIGLDNVKDLIHKLPLL